MLPQTARSRANREPERSIAYHAKRPNPHGNHAMTSEQRDALPSGDPARDAVAGALAQAHAVWSAGDRARAMTMLAALAAREGTAEVWSRLGGYALESGDNDAAYDALRNAVASAPGDVASWTNLGTALLRRARMDEAIGAYRRALELDPRAVGARVNLGNALQQVGDLDGAVAELEEVRRVAPEAAEALNNLGNLYKDQGRFDDAFAAYDAARRARPDFRPAFSNLLALTKLSTRHTPVEVFALHRAFAERFEFEWQAAYVPPRNTPDPGRRLRIGYVSPDCHTALPAFVLPVLRHHDRERFEVFAYFNNPQPAETLARVAPIASRVMKGAPDDDVARWIRSDGIDLLIDIAGHTGHNRLGVFGMKPAPVAITWLDYLNTTGLDSIDYRLTDAASDPPGQSDALHSETLLRLAPAQWCWNPPTAVSAPDPLPAGKTGHLTLGSFNNYSKLTDAALALWARVLAALPEARLVIVGVPGGIAQARVAAAFGPVGADRVRVLPRQSADAFRQTIASVDIALDPLPFSGATTTLEALWQGVPVVTRPGATSASRSCASILAALDLGSWIAAGDDDYIGIIERNGAELGALATLRAELPAKLAQSGLTDAARFTRELERTYSAVWQTWCANRKSVWSTTETPSPAGVEITPRAPALRRLKLDRRLDALESALRAGQGADVVADACALIDEMPHWHAAQRVYLQALLAWATTQPGLVARVFPPPPSIARAPKTSVLVCSIDPARFRSVTASYEARFAGHPFEIVGIHDARSLAEGYNRAAAQSTGDVLVFSHDDIELVTPDFAQRLLGHLEHHDGVGVAGASQARGPRWGDAGQRAIHGHILHAPPPGRKGALLMVSGFQLPVVEGIRLLDGAFIAVRRHVWEATRFDAERYDGFHFYDLDFTWRASDAGARLAVPADLTLFHASQGRYGEAWRRYARRFVDAAGLDPLAPPRPGGLQTRLETPAQIDALRAAMVHFRFGAPVAYRER